MSTIAKRVAIIGAPGNRGQEKPGVSKAPAAMREAGLISELTDLGMDVKDFGDISLDVMTSKDGPSTIVYGAKNPKPVGQYTHKVSEVVSKLTSENDLTIVLGGDHSIGIGSVNGHAQSNPDVCVIWVDAHCDLNPPPCSFTHNIHGMAVAFNLLEFDEYMPTLPGFEWLKRCVHAKDVAYIGLRQVDPSERLLAEKYGMTKLSMHEVDKYGIVNCVKMVLDKINPNNDRPIHLSFDVDGLDPSIVPSTGTPEKGGLTYREGMYIVEEIAKTGKVSLMDIVELNPTLGSKEDQEKSIKVAVDLAKAVCGSYRGGNIPKGYTIPRYEDMPEHSQYKK